MRESVPIGKACSMCKMIYPLDALRDLYADPWAIAMGMGQNLKDVCFNCVPE